MSMLEGKKLFLPSAPEEGLPIHQCTTRVCHKSAWNVQHFLHLYSSPLLSLSLAGLWQSVHLPFCHALQQLIQICNLQGLRATADSVAKKAQATREAMARERVLQGERDVRLIEETEAEDAEMLAALETFTESGHQTKPDGFDSSRELSRSVSSAACQPAAQMPCAWFVADLLKLLGSASAFQAATWSDPILLQLLCLAGGPYGHKEFEYVSLSASKQLSSQSASLGSALMCEVLQTPVQGISSLTEYLGGHKSALQMALSIISVLPQGDDRSRLAKFTAPLLLDVAMSLPCQSANITKGCSGNMSDSVDKSMNLECRCREACKQVIKLFGSDLVSLEEFLVKHKLVKAFCRTRSKSPELLGLKKHLEEQFAAQAVQARRPAPKQHSASQSASTSLSSKTVRPASQPSIPQGRSAIPPWKHQHQSTAWAADQPSSHREALVPETAESFGFSRSELAAHGLPDPSAPGGSKSNGHHAGQAAEANDSHLDPEGWQMVFKGKGTKHNASPASGFPTTQQVARPDSYGSALLFSKLSAGCSPRLQV